MSQYGEQYGGAERKKTSPWVWVAVGCGGVVLLGIIAVVGLGFWGVQKAKQFGDEIRDPVAREAKVLDALGATELPPGYHAAMAMEIPFLMEMAMLTDEPVTFEEEGGPGVEIDPDSFEGDRGFFYFKMPFSARKRQEMDDFFSGRSDDTAFLEDSGINVPRGDLLTRGSITSGKARVRYLVQKSSGHGLSSFDRRGLTTVMMIECPDSNRLQSGLWFSRDGLPEAREEGADAASTEEGAAAGAEALPAEAPEGTEAESTAADEAMIDETGAEETGAEAEEIDLTGTVGDEAMIAEFLSYFDFCR